MARKQCRVSFENCCVDESLMAKLCSTPKLRRKYATLNPLLLRRLAEISRTDPTSHQAQCAGLAHLQLDYNWTARYLPIRQKCSFHKLCILSEFMKFVNIFNVRCSPSLCSGCFCRSGFGEWYWHILLF